MNEPLVDVTGHRLRRQREARRRLVRRVAVALGLLALVAGLMWVVVGSSLFRVREVVVSGNQLVTTDQVVSAAAIELDSPLATIDDQGIASRVRELPPVVQVAVERDWPSTVTLRITERQARLALARAGGFDWVDPKGVVFHHTADLPEGTMVATPNDDPRVLAGMVTVVNALPPKVVARTKGMAAESVDSIVVRLDDGSQIVWGSPEQSDLKAQLVAALLDTPAGVYDVSSPSHPTTRPR